MFKYIRETFPIFTVVVKVLVSLLVISIIVSTFGAVASIACTSIGCVGSAGIAKLLEQTNSKKSN